VVEVVGEPVGKRRSIIATVPRAHGDLSPRARIYATVRYAWRPLSFRISANVSPNLKYVRCRGRRGGGVGEVNGVKPQYLYKTKGCTVTARIKSRFIFLVQRPSHIDLLERIIYRLWSRQ
jgi:hypothetical protein